MYALIAPFRPIGKGQSLTYALCEKEHNTIGIGDIIEIPIQHTRAVGIVLKIIFTEPEYKTKTAGKILAKNIFSANFLEFLLASAEYSFAEISAFLPSTIPKKVHNQLYISPQKKVWKLLSPSSEIKYGKKQQQIIDWLTANKTSELADFKNLKITSSSLKTLEEKKAIAYEYKNTYEYVESKYIFPPSLIKSIDSIETFDFHSQKNIILGSNISIKNIVLLQWIKKIIEEKKQVLFLFPDRISLLQIAKKFKAILPENFFTVFHGGMTPDQQGKIFWEISSGQIPLVLSTKKAIFFPFHSLGGIVVHQYNDDGYQSLSKPYFFAPHIAKIRSEKENIPLLFSSTTGDIREIYEIQEKKNGKIFSFPSLSTPNIQIIDMNIERSNSNQSLLSSPLENAINHALEKKEQILLFLNRRGVHTALLCRTCGYSPISPLSGQRMAIFKDSFGKKILQCPVSKYQENIPEKCEKCGSNNFFEHGSGTQKGEEIIEKKFPTARIVRIDSDTITSISKINSILEDIKDGNIDIIIGTTMILKAFAFENVSVVGSIFAENDFLFPHYSAEEKGFEQAMKLIDSGGKNFPKAQIFLQTSIPFHSLFEDIRNQNFEHFYSKELTTRKQLNFPPYTQSIILYAQGKRKPSLEEKFIKAFKIFSSQNIKIFPPKISYHPARKIFMAQMEIFCVDINEFLYQEKNIEAMKGINLKRG